MTAILAGMVTRGVVEVVEIDGEECEGKERDGVWGEGKRKSWIFVYAIQIAISDGLLDPASLINSALELTVAVLDYWIDSDSALAHQFVLVADCCGLIVAVTFELET